ncbi:MAG: hypothetical protein U9N84_01450 [Actinomycetota bacterium]|nr:hypothetical protein [Actinomycetota bacterium]
MRSFVYLVAELVASHSVAVTVAVLTTVTLVLLVLSGVAGRAVLRFQERPGSFI